MTPQPPNGTGPKARLAAANKRRLQQAAVDVDAIANPAKREQLLAELRSEISGTFDPRRGATSGADAWGLLSECLALDSIRALVDVIPLVDGETREWKAFSDLVEELFPAGILTADDQAALNPLVREVPSTAILVAAHKIGLADYDSSVGAASDGVAVLGAIKQRITDGQLPEDALWRFLELAAHYSPPTIQADLHRVIGVAAARHQAVDFVREICHGYVDDIDNMPSIEPDIGKSNDSDQTVTSSSEQPIGAEDMSPTAVASAVRSLPVVMRGLPPQNKFFAGRTEILNRIHETLESRSEATVLPHTLHGLGGVGKTQVAAEYAYRYASQYDMVFWIPADDEGNIRRSMVSLGKALDIPETSDHSYMIQQTLDELRLGRRCSNWLLVFDNATEPAEVRKYIPDTAANVGSRHVLVTSRTSAWRSERTEFIEIDVFSAEESSAFLALRWPELSSEEGGRLADRLGHLPLALNLAAAFHAETGIQLSDYLDNYDELVGIVTGAVSPDYPEPVAKTWRLAYEVLSPGAAQLLQVCCFLSSEPIYTPLIREGRGADLPAELKMILQNELKFRMAVQELGRYALAQIDPNRDFITIHSLVRAVLRDGLDIDGRSTVQHWSHGVLAYANPGEPDSGDTWNRHAHIAPHIAASGVMYSDDEHARQVVLDQIRYQFAIGDFDVSAKLARQAVDDWRSRLGELDVMTLRARFHLGNALRNRGDHREAMQETEIAHERLSESLGAEHEYTLAAANGLGAGLRFLGEFERARVQDADVLERHRAKENAARPVGVIDDGIGAIRAANNLAVDLRLLGLFRDARDIDQQNVDLLTRDDAASANPDTLRSINHLVRDLIGVGSYDEALQLQTARLTSFEANLRTHQLIRDAYRNLAILHRKLGDYPAALKLSEQEARLAQETVGPQSAGRHRGSALAAAATLVNARRVSGTVAVNHLEGVELLTSARSLGEEVVSDYEHLLQAEHPITVAVAVNLGAVCRALGERGRARELDERSLSVLRKRLGDDHPYTLSCLANQANNLALASENTAALDISRDVYARSKLLRGPSHPNTLAAAANLVLDLDLSGDHAAAAKLRKPTIDSLRSVLGSEHPETVNVERGRRVEIDIEVPSW